MGVGDAPAAGWNPGADLQRAQRRAVARLLERELDEFAPRRVLAMTGGGWMRPFTQSLELQIHERAGLVEGVGLRGGQAWVVAKHPMAKPERQFVEAVAGAFAELTAADAHASGPFGSFG